MHQKRSHPDFFHHSHLDFNFEVFAQRREDASFFYSSSFIEPNSQKEKKTKTKRKKKIEKRREKEEKKKRKR